MEAGMKSWKDHAHLFCNGKFKLKYPEYHNPIRFNAYWYNNLENELNRCTLIARKIEHMTITEYEDVFYALYGNEEEDLYNEYFKHNQLHDFVLMNVNKTPVFLHLLSIGVYPFDQSHFGETVIDINTL